MMDSKKLRWQSAGHQVITRSQAVDRLNSDVADIDQLEEELKQFIPTPGSSTESIHLRRLREMENKAGKRSLNGISSAHDEEGSGSMQLDRRRRHVTYSKNANGQVIETELYWFGKRLVWSKGAVPIRSFSYEEDVKCACWAWMDTESSDLDDEMASQISSGNASSSSNIQEQPDEAKAKRISKGSFRALCVFLSSCMVIYHPHSGQEYIKRLDLNVKEVYPLDIGILIQREMEVEDRKKAKILRNEDELSDRPLATLFYLRRPFDELKAVEVVNEIRYSSISNKMDTASVSSNADLRSFDEVDESVVMASIEPPVLVSYSQQNESLRIYAYAHHQSPFKRHEMTPSEQTDMNTKGEEHTVRLSSSTLMRRSTTDISRPCPSTRQKLPPRKSVRLESGSNRASIGGQRSSMAGKRPRTISNPGHVRRVSAGFNSVFGHGAFLHDEQEHADTDEENLQDVMQLLDEFEEVQEDTSLLQGASANPPVLGTLTQGTNASHRRRVSRATILPSAQQSVVAPISNASTRATTTLQKTRPIDGRRISRSRMSMALGNSNEGNPISVAMELTQKDEASKMALTASTDKALSRGLSIEVVKVKDDPQTQSLTLFSTFSQAFAAVSLLEEISLKKSDIDSNGIEAFTKNTDGNVLLHIVVPSTSRLITRQIFEITIKNAAHNTLQSQLPSPSIADSEVKCYNAFSVKSSMREDSLLLQAESKASLHLVLGPPGPLAVSTDLNLERQDIIQAQGMPLHLTTGGLSQLAIKTEPSCPLTRRVLSMCECILEPRLFREMQMAWIKSQPVRKEQEWQTLSDLFLYGFVPMQQSESQMCSRPELDQMLDSMGKSSSTGPKVQPHQSIWAAEEMANIITLLNWAAQEARADICERVKDLPRLGQIIITISCRLGWKQWLDYWLRLLPSTTHFEIIYEASSSIASIDEAHLVDLYDFVQDNKAEAIKTIPDKIKTFLPKMMMLRNIQSASLESSKMPYHDCMSGLPMSSDLYASVKIVNSMLTNHFDLHQLKRLPFSLALSMYEAINHCRQDTPIGWSRQAYSFIGRQDLTKQLAPRLSEQSNAVEPLPPNRLFPHDYRLKEVDEMLQSSRPVAVRGPEVASAEDQELIAEKQKRVFVSASDRIKSLSIGRGMYNLSSIAFKSTEQWKILPISLRIKMLNNCIIQNREPDMESAEMEWPEFHNGVASALQLSIDNNHKVESTWLYSQLNKVFNSRHAGFILGIGLLGQLTNLGKIHAHQYLSHRHSPTTIGLLLGISLSFISSCDPLAKALMSIHLIHTLPIHSRPLKTSMLEQSAALVGLGFVFLKSKDRWASRMAFKAIATETVFTDDNQMLKRECFSLSAGISLGLTCLGGGRKGATLVGEIEKEIIPGLEKLIKVFVRENSKEEEDDQSKDKKMIDEKQYSAFEWAPDISLTTSPASIALALIYLKSNRTDKAEKMPLPQSMDQLDSIRPDMLTIRALCRSLIQWDAIKATSDWLMNILPVFLQFKDVKTIRKSSENNQLAFWSLRLGSIFAIGLKYAGSNDISARACLMEQLHLYQSQLDLRPNHYFEKIRQQLLQSSIDVILTLLSMIMAGTGDVEVLQYLRKGLYRIDNLRFGNYMANSMAIGLLFLGAGRFTLSSTDLAIAALLISFYPRYPINAQDNKCHLQVYRHFWILAVESRLLSVEDVEMGDSIQIPVILDKRGQGGIISLSSPCLLPQLDQVKSIRIASNRYYPSILQLQGNDQVKGNLNTVRKLYVKKRRADLSHDEDRWGKSSIRAQRMGMNDCLELPCSSQDDMKQTRYHKDAREELKRLIQDHVHDEEVHTLLDVVLHRDGSIKAEEETVELFILQSIMECLLEDKMEILPIMIRLQSATQAFLIGSWSNDHLFHLQDVHCTLELIKKRRNKESFNLLKKKYLVALWELMQDKMISELMLEGDDSSLKQALIRYAKSVDDDDKSSLSSSSLSSAWEIEYEQRQKLAALLILAEVPSLSILKEMKILFDKQSRNRQNTAVETTSALMKSVLLQVGHNVRIEVLKIILEAWHS